MSFQKVVKHIHKYGISDTSFRTVSFQKVVKHEQGRKVIDFSFRTVSFQKVVKQPVETPKSDTVLELCHFRR